MTYLLIIAAGSVIGYAPLYDTTCEDALAQIETEHLAACATEETLYTLLDGATS